MESESEDELAEASAKAAEVAQDATRVTTRRHARESEETIVEGFGLSPLKDASIVASLVLVSVTATYFFARHAIDHAEGEFVF